MFFEYSMESFLQNFSNVQYSLNIFEGYSIQEKMSCSKFKLSACMKRKNLSLDKKMKVIDYANKNLKVGCSLIAQHFRLKFLKGHKNSSKGI